MGNAPWYVMACHLLSCKVIRRHVMSCYLTRCDVVFRNTSSPLLHFLLFFPPDLPGLTSILISFFFHHLYCWFISCFPFLLLFFFLTFYPVNSPPVCLYVCHFHCFFLHLFFPSHRILRAYGCFLVYL